jgi:hypothetical protein
VFAEEIGETPESIRNRARRHAGEVTAIGSDRPKKQEGEKTHTASPEPTGKKFVFDNEAIVGTARYFLIIATGQMGRIMEDDPGREAAFREMVEWCRSEMARWPKKVKSEPRQPSLF